MRLEQKLTDAVIKRSVTLAGHRTSVSLEEPFWRHLKRIARTRGISLSALVQEIDTARISSAARHVPEGNLSSALRLHVLTDLEQALDRGSIAAKVPSSS